MPEKDFPGEDNKLGDFFPRSPDSEWNGSSFLISMSYRRGRELINDEKKAMGNLRLEVQDGFQYTLDVQVKRSLLSWDR